MQAKPAGKHTIAISHLNFIADTDTSHGQTAGNTFLPNFNVASGVTHHCRLARGSRRSMQAHDLRLRGSEKPVRIVVTQVIFYRKRQAADIINAGNITGSNIQFLQLMTIKRDMMIKPAD